MDVQWYFELNRVKFNRVLQNLDKNCRGNHICALPHSWHARINSMYARIISMSVRNLLSRLHVKVNVSIIRCTLFCFSIARSSGLWAWEVCWYLYPITFPASLIKSAARFRPNWRSHPLCDNNNSHGRKDLQEFATENLPPASIWNFKNAGTIPFLESQIFKSHLNHACTDHTADTGSPHLVPVARNSRVNDYLL
jgi:hypothetical protein